MELVEAVAVWIGLLTGLVATVLAIVSIVFTYAVDKRSTGINTQMIQTLQKIESEVERSTADTANLIKVAWERMLPAADGSGGRARDDSTDGLGNDTAKQIALGVAAELRSDLAAIEGSQTLAADLNNLVAQFEETIEAQLESASNKSRRAQTDQIFDALDSLSPTALALVVALANGRLHLNAAQYSALKQGSLGSAIRELRKSGLLVPLSGHEKNEKTVVYWLPPGSAGTVGGLARLLDPPEAEVSEEVANELRRVGYKPRSTRRTTTDHREP